MRTLWMAAVLAAPLWAQPASPEAQQEKTRALIGAAETVHRIVPLKYIDPRAAQNLLRDFGVDLRVDRDLKVVALSGRRSAVETAEAALKQLDVPSAAQKDVDLTVFFVVGRDDNETGGTAIPQDLHSTVAALKQTFPYKNYELLDALSLRTRMGGSATTTGQIASNRLTRFAVGSVSLEGDGMIRIDRLNAGIRALQNLGNKNDYVDVTSVGAEVVDVKDGQKLVVGRASMNGPGRALFLVLIAKVAQ